MNYVIIGNIVFLIASIISTLIGLIKDKQKYLLYQLIVFTIMGIGNVLLKGYSGVIANAISIIRNIVCIKYTYKPSIKYLFVILQLVVTIIFNQEGLVGYLPVLAVGVYTLLIDQNNQVRFKYVVIISQAIWIIYDILILNFVDVVFGISTIATNLYTAIKIQKENKKSDDKR